MDKKKLLKHLVFLMFFIFIVYLLNLKFFWDSLLWYFDMGVHFLSGLWVGMFFLYVLSTKNPILLSLKSFLKITLLVLIIGILWELFQYIMNIISTTPFDPVDSTSDVIFDLLGSALSFFYYAKIIMPIKENTI